MRINLATVSLVLYFSVLPSVNAGCFSIYTRMSGGTCQAVVQNSCGRQIQCYVNVTGVHSSGRRYTGSGTVRVNNGDENWWGISNVIGCAGSNAQCQ